MAFWFSQLNTAVPRRNTKIEVTLQVSWKGCVISGDIGQCCLKLFQAFGSCERISVSCCLGSQDGALVQVISLTVELNVVQLMCAVDVIKSLGFCVSVVTPSEPLQACSLCRD